MASTLLTSDSTLPLLQTVGIILTGSVGAGNYVLSNVSVPALIDNTPSSSSVARTWLVTYKRAKRRALTATAISALVWSASIYRALDSKASAASRSKLPYFVVALLGTVSIVPWTVITMEPYTNRRLMDAVERADRVGSKAFDEDGAVDGQVRDEARFWDLMNNVRAAISGVGAVAGLVSLW